MVDRNLPQLEPRVSLGTLAVPSHRRIVAANDEGEERQGVSFCQSATGNAGARPVGNAHKFVVTVPATSVQPAVEQKFMFWVHKASLVVALSMVRLYLSTRHTIPDTD